MKMVAFAVALAVSVACRDRAPRSLTAVPGEYAGTVQPCPEKGTLGEGRSASSFVRAAQAPMLSCGDAPETYRLTWLPAFRAVYMISVTDVGSEWQITSVAFEDPRLQQPPYRRDQIARSSTRTLSADQVERIRESLAFLNVWSAETLRNNTEVDDGWTVVLEARNGNTYRSLTRTNVDDLAMMDTAETLILASGLPLPQPIRRLTGGYGTARVDPWAILERKTAWIHLGLIDVEFDSWVTQRDFEAPIKEYRPKVGDVLTMIRPTPLYVMGWWRTREQRQFESPAGQILSEGDSIEAALYPSARVRIEEISIGKGGPAREVWARVSPGTNP